MNWIVCLISMAWVIISAIISVAENTFTKSLMLQAGIIKKIDDKCLPFYAHGGMWADFFLMSAMLGMMWTYHEQWDHIRWIVCGAISTAASIGMHVQYRKGDPCSTNYGGKIIIAGYLHMIYFAVAMTIMLLTLFCTSGMSLVHIIAISAMLAVFFPLGMLQPAIYVHGKFDGQAKFQFYGAIIGLFIGLVLRFVLIKAAV